MTDSHTRSPIDKTPGRIAQLVRALNAETGILLELRETLVKQREAVAISNQESVENSIHAMGRIILTLEETRRQRRSLLGLVCNGEDVSLNDIEEYVSVVPEDFIEARAAVREQSVATANDLAINQHVLDRVLQAGDTFLQRLFSSALEASPSYASSVEDEGTTAAMLVNRTV